MMTNPILKRSHKNNGEKTNQNFKDNVSDLILPFDKFSDDNTIEKCEKNLNFDEIIIKILEQEIKSSME